MHGARKEQKGRELLLEIVAFALCARRKEDGGLLLAAPAFPELTNALPLAISQLCNLVVL
jgi:hypothetical protein